MLTPPPDMHPECPWADQPVAATTPFGIGSAATVEPRTGLTIRYKVTAYDPHARSVTVTPDMKEDRAGVVRPAPDRDQPRTVPLDDNIKTAFTAGGDQGVPASRRVYRIWMQTTEGHTSRFLVRAPSQTQAHDAARAWWQGIPCPEGWTGGRLADGDSIDILTCEGARDMPVWPYRDHIAAPV